MTQIIYLSNNKHLVNILNFITYLQDYITHKIKVSYFHGYIFLHIFKI